MSDVKQYQLSIKRGGGIPLSGRVRLFVTILSLVFFLQWLLGTLVPFLSNLKPNNTVDLFFMPLWLAIWCALFPGAQEITLTIGDDFVEKQIPLGWYTIRKRITRQKSKSVREVILRHRDADFPRRGLVVSNHGRITSWLFGPVFIPATIPHNDYKEIKNRLMQWNPPKTSLGRVLS